MTVVSKDDPGPTISLSPGLTISVPKYICPKGHVVTGADQHFCARCFEAWLRATFPTKRVEGEP
jgi:hypothetical protein